MAQELYNEGRVLGFSAWEIFARDALDHGIPPEDIPNEHEWLEAMLCNGNSVILKVPLGTQAGVRDFPLPEGSTLAGSNAVLGSLFVGTCECDASGFAKKVTSYGPLINNTSSSSPTSNSNNPVPYDTSTSPYAPYMSAIMEFVKINDGIVYIKKAKWIRTPDGSGEPYKDIDPNFANSTTVVRLYLAETLNADVYILLSGFENKVFLNGISGWAHEDAGRSTGGSTDTDNNNWQNGNMLGPEVIPWATKIVFTVPSSAYTLSTNITRTIPSDASYGSSGEEINIGGIKIHDYLQYRSNTTPFIDFDSINLTDYYTVHNFSTSPTLRENITDVNFGFTNSYNSLVAWYPGMTAQQINSATSNAKFFPPALYAAKITNKGQQTLVPIDVAAPGTIKCFTNSTDAYNYTQILPNNYAVYYNTSNHSFTFVTNGDSDVNNWYGTAKIDFLTAPKVKISTNATAVKLLALSTSTGTDYSTNGTSGSITTKTARNLKWDDLMTALTSNYTINILGDRLTAFATELATGSYGTIGTDTTNNKIAEIGATKLTINPGTDGVSFTTTTTQGTKLATLGTGTSIKSGTNFIEFSNGLRLYISPTNPGNTNVPVGSIGIGW
ncbi:MAG: hypothetical protein J5725_08815 [Bacteroidales bacterium]|nr:hypothetical protein [Bacteroidales bacterium]